MRVLVLGADGYLGWPTAMHLASCGHEVTVLDSYVKREWTRKLGIKSLYPVPYLGQRAELYSEMTGRFMQCDIGDCGDYEFMEEVFTCFDPEAVVHFAEQPSGPYSMIDHRRAAMTLHNNLGVTLNLAWAVHQHAPDCHIVKLGTMGEYGTPNIDIPEGWWDVEHNGRTDRLLFPREAGSLYHTTKIMDTDLLWFYVRMCGLRVTDLMQGPVYGLETPETAIAPTTFHYDDIFGTVVNRFIAQAVAGIPLTVYGSGSQTRGYINLADTVECIRLAVENPAEPGELRVFNQITETLSVNDIAEKVCRVGDTMCLAAEVDRIDNPRKEAEQHYYNPTYTGLADLGLKPHLMTDDVLAGMLEEVQRHRDAIDTTQIQPRVRWPE